MAIPFDETKRQVIPRWRRPRSEASMLEQPSRAQGAERRFHSPSSLNQKIEDWKRNRSLSFATDLLGEALIICDKSSDTIAAVDFVLKPDSGASYAAKSLASRIHKIVQQPPRPAVDQPPIILDKDDFKLQIHETRQRLRRTPDNALAWSDLSYAYGSIGLNDDAWRAMRIALALAPNNRYLLRSAVRLLMHAKKPDRALHLLRSSDPLQSDPWLVAAEIAVSNRIDKAPKTIRASKRLLNSGNFPPFHLSACTLAITLSF